MKFFLHHIFQSYWTWLTISCFRLITRTLVVRGPNNSAEIQLAYSPGRAALTEDKNTRKADNERRVKHSCMHLMYHVGEVLNTMKVFAAEGKRPYK